MWEPIPKHRPNLSEIFDHPWVMQYSNTSRQDFLKEIGVDYEEEMKIDDFETKSQTMSVDEV